MSALSPEDRRRYGRQIRLADIGEAGQAKLCAFEARLGGEGFARTIEERYARGAGLRVDPSLAPDQASSFDAGALGLQHDAAKDVADGAWRALLAIRAALVEAKDEAK